MINVLQIVLETEAQKQKTLTIKNVRSADMITKAKIVAIFEASKKAIIVNGMPITKLVSAKVTQIESTSLEII